MEKILSNNKGWFSSGYYIGAYQGMGMGVRNGRWDGLFIGKVHHQLSDRAVDVRQPYRTFGGPNGISYIQVLPKLYSKK
jgi:hypothetical protein